MPNHAEQLAAELNLSVKNVQGAIDLIDQGNTIPFIARYRKEATGSMDDQVLRNLGDRLEYLRNLQKRREEVIRSITEQEKLTPELEAAILAAKTLAEVEDLYRPYKPKRRTRGSIAREKGLEPLAAAKAGVYIHGLCGDITARELSARGMTVADMTELLGALMSEFE